MKQNNLFKPRADGPARDFSSTIMRAPIDELHFLELEFHDGMRTIYRIVNHELGNEPD